jgi:SulP family sulfate permease
LRQELAPARLIASATAGLVLGILIVVIEISFAALIFSGELSGFVSNGIGLTLAGAVVLNLIVALTSSFPPSIAPPQDAPVAILAVVAAAIVSGMPGVPPEAHFLTVCAALILASILSGAASLLLGIFRLGDFVRYVPYPVIGGFLAATGWLLATGALGVMTDFSLSLATLSRFFEPAMLIRWVPGVVFGVALLFVLRRYSHFLVLPGMILAGVTLFYALLLITGSSVEQASQQGFLLGPFPQGGLWHPFNVGELELIDWHALLAQANSFAVVALISVTSLLLNASGLEVASGQEIDLNRELRNNGIANLAAGAVGSPPGYTALSLSILGGRIGMNSRLVGIFVALFIGMTLFLGAAIFSYFPKMVLGGLLFFLGLSFMVEWLVDGWSRMSRTDYLVIVLIIGAIVLFGVLQGVGIGLSLAVILFVINYSQLNIVNHTFSGSSYRSNVERPPADRQVLRQHGDLTHILQLQGFIFFGTANKLLAQVRQRVEDTRLIKPQFLVIDFGQVPGMDASALMIFTRIKQLAKAQTIMLVFTSLSPMLQQRFEKEVFPDSGESIWRVFQDMDRGVEWCEKNILDEFGLPGEASVITPAQQLQPYCSDPATAARLENYLEKREIPAGHHLIRQNDSTVGLYFLEQGQLSVELEIPDNMPTRLRSVVPGTFLGEIGLYLGTPASASVIAVAPSTIFLLSRQQLTRMKTNDPALAAAFHEFAAHQLSERFLNSTETLQAMK